MKKEQGRIPYWFVLIIGILAVSTASIFIRYAQDSVPSLVIASYRLGIAALFLSPFALKNRKELAGVEIKPLFLMMLAGIFLGFHFATWITSLEYTSVTSSVVIVTTAPLWVAIFSPIFLKEKISGWNFFGIGLALIGGIVVSLGDSCKIELLKINCEISGGFSLGTSMKGNLLALAGAIFSSAYMMIGRRIRVKHSLLTYTFIVYSAAAILLITLTLIKGHPLLGYSFSAYLLFFALAFFPQLIGHSAFNYSLKYAKASLVSIALLGEPVGTVILAMLFLKESPALLEIIGGCFILMGILIVSRMENSDKMSEKSKSLDRLQ